METLSDDWMFGFEPFITPNLGHPDGNPFDPAPPPSLLSSSLLTTYPSQQLLSSGNSLFLPAPGFQDGLTVNCNQPQLSPEHTLPSVDYSDCCDRTPLASPSPELDRRPKEGGIHFCADTGTLTCSLGVFQHLQFLLPDHPVVQEAVISRLNASVKEFLKKKSEGEEGRGYLSISSKEHGELYKLIKQSEFLKQRNTYFLIAVDRKEDVREFLDNRLKNRRSSNKRKSKEGKKNSSAEKGDIKAHKRPKKEASKSSEPLLPRQVEQHKQEEPQKKQEVAHKNEKECSSSAKCLHSVRNSAGKQLFQVCSEQQSSRSDNFCFIDPLASSVSSQSLPPGGSSTSSVNFSEGAPVYFFGEEHLCEQQQHGGSEFFNDKLLQRHGVDLDFPQTLVDFVQRCCQLGKVCKSPVFSLARDDLSELASALLLFSQQYSALPKPPLRSLKLKSAQSPLCQLLTVPQELSLLLEAHSAAHVQLRSALEALRTPEIPALLEREAQLSAAVASKVRECFAFVRSLGLEGAQFFLEEDLSGASAVGCCLLLEGSERVRVLGTFEDHGTFRIAPVRFCEAALREAATEIGRALRLLARAEHAPAASLFVNLSFLSRLNDQSFQFVLSDVQLASAASFALPLGFLECPAPKPSHFLLFAEHRLEGNVVGRFVEEFPAFRGIPFFGIRHRILQVRFVPLANVTVVSSTLELQSEKLFHSAAAFENSLKLFVASKQN